MYVQTKLCIQLFSTWVKMVKEKEQKVEEEAYEQAKTEKEKDIANYLQSNIHKIL